MKLRSPSDLHFRRSTIAAAGLCLFVACGGGSTTGGDATNGPSNSCSGGSGNLGADRAGVFAAALGSKQLKTDDTVNVATSATTNNDITLSNVASGFGALEIAVESVTFDYAAPTGGKDSAKPAFECQTDDGTGAAGAPNWVPCKGVAWPTLIPNDPSFDEACASAKHAKKQTIRIVYHKPTDNGPRNATLTVNHIDTIAAAGSAPKITPFVIKLAAKVGTPAIKLDPPEIDFGTVPMGADSTSTVTISNQGDGDLEIKALTLAKVAPKFFSVLTDDNLKFDGNAAPIAIDPPWIITPGSAKSMVVTFHGLDTVGHGAELTFSSNDAKNAEATVQLKANQKVACIKIVPDKLLNWGAVLVGQASVKSVQLKNCGTEDLVLSNFALKDDTDTSFLLDPTTILLGQSPAGPAPITAHQNQTVTVPVTCTPPAAQKDPFTANLTFTDNTLTPQKTVALQCTGVTTSCATPLIACLEGEEVPPQSVIHLDATGSLVGPGKSLTYKWSVIQQPKGTDAYTFTPSDTASKVSFGTTTNTANGPQIQLNVVGVYKFRLEVKDSGGQDGCGPTDYTVQVVPDAGLHVELLWDTPSDTNKGDKDGADLDLHFAHPDAEKANICVDPPKLCSGKPCACQVDGDADGQPDPWFADTFDCYWFNPQPFWGNSLLPDDDPFLALDDTDGWGPENLNMAAPQNLLYRIGVHYWDAHDYGDSTATIHIWINSNLVGTFTQLLKECDLWWVKRLDYANQTLTDYPNAGANGKVTPAYKASQFAGLSAKCK